MKKLYIRPYDGKKVWNSIFKLTPLAIPDKWPTVIETQWARES